MKKIKQIVRLVGVLTLVTGMVLQLIPSGMASAAQITTRSLTLQPGGTDGGSKAGGVVNHFFTFTVPTTASIGSIQFLYCTLAAGTCTTPTGLVTTSATYGVESGATGFSLVNATNGAPYITRAAASITAATVVSYHLNTITNPTTANQTFYVRLTTFTSTTATTGATDAGVVAASTANQITLTGTMPESLIFCAGGTISTTAGVPDCTTATSGSILFNQLFSPTDTATTTSQIAASTNANSGYNITVAGTTLTSGSNTVTAMGSATTGVHGVSQFGMNLKANTTATSTIAIGTEVAAASNTTTLRGQSLAGYNTVDTFKFVTGDSVANSGNAVLGPTNAQIYTVSYIVNVPGSQPAGTYTTTLTYVCTPTY
jgi:hypothetical protein